MSKQKRWTEEEKRLYWEAAATDCEEKEAELTRWRECRERFVEAERLVRLTSEPIMWYRGKAEGSDRWLIETDSGGEVLEFPATDPELTPEQHDRYSSIHAKGKTEAFLNVNWLPVGLLAWYPPAWLRVDEKNREQLVQLIEYEIKYHAQIITVGQGKRKVILDMPSILQQAADDLRGGALSVLIPALPIGEQGREILKMANYAGITDVTSAWEVGEWSTDTSSLPTTHLRRTGGTAVLVPYDMPAPSHVTGLTPEELNTTLLAMNRQSMSFVGLERTALIGANHLWLQRASRPEEMVMIGIDEILDLRGKARAKGSHRRADRQKLVQAFSHVANTWLSLPNQWVEVPDKKKPVQKDVKTRLVLIDKQVGKFGQGVLFSADYYLDPNTEYMLYRPGLHFAQAMLSKKKGMKQIALLDAKALQYDYKKNAWEQRLAAYMASLWRTNLFTKGVGPFQRDFAVVTILNEIVKGGFNSRRAAAQQARLEKALDRLEKNNLISSWEYKRGLPGNSREWRRAVIHVLAPGWMSQDWAENQKSLPPKQERLKPAVIIRGMREQIKKAGTSQSEAARQIGISRKQVGNLLSGESRSPRQATLDKIAAWLKTKNG